MKEKAKCEELTAKEKQELEIEKKRELEIEEKQILKSVELKNDHKKREEQNRDESGLSDEGKWYWESHQLEKPAWKLFWDTGKKGKFEEFLVISDIKSKNSEGFP